LSETDSGVPAKVAYVIGLGGNLGDRLGHLRTAVKRLRELGEVLGLSRVYETDPIGPAQPDYLNAAVLLRCALAPEQLLRKLHVIEAEQGRERFERWGPRTIDLDILWAKDLVHDTNVLTVPHALLAERDFAKAPLLDLVPDAKDPTTGTAYALAGPLRVFDGTLA